MKRREDEDKINGRKLDSQTKIYKNCQKKRKNNSSNKKYENK